MKPFRLRWWSYSRRANSSHSARGISLLYLFPNPSDVLASSRLLTSASTCPPPSAGGSAIAGRGGASALPLRKSDLFQRLSRLRSLWGFPDFDVSRRLPEEIWVEFSPRLPPKGQKLRNQDKTQFPLLWFCPACLPPLINSGAVGRLIPPPLNEVGRQFRIWAQ